jgi:hypothetical protein
MVKVYAALDAIPGYLVKFDPSLSVEENIEERIFRKGEFLNLEPEFLLKEVLRDPSNYMRILRTIAAGNSAFNELCNSSRLDKSLVSKYLGRFFQSQRYRFSLSFIQNHHKSLL